MYLATGLLTIYIWAIVCILLFFLFAIARFYQQKSGRRSFYASFIIPIILFAAAAVKYALIGPVIIGDLWGDLLRFLGGVFVTGFGLFLLRLMMGGRS